MIDEDVVTSWKNVPVDELATHSFLITIPMIKTISDGGVEIRNYRNGVCNNFFTSRIAWLRNIDLRARVKR